MSESPSPTDTPTHTNQEDLSMKSAFVQKEASPKRYTEDFSRSVLSARTLVDLSDKSKQ